jgi:hypothetical protein
MVAAHLFSGDWLSNREEIPAPQPDCTRDTVWEMACIEISFTAKVPPASLRRVPASGADVPRGDQTVTRLALIRQICYNSPYHRAVTRTKERSYGMGRESAQPWPGGTMQTLRLLAQHGET